MFQGNWTCSKCGGAITQLPFEPKSDKGLTCRECYFKEKDGQASGNGAPAAAPTPAPADEQTDAPPFDPDAPPFDPDMAPATDMPDAPPDDPGTSPASGERKMFQGDWQCSICGGSITQLPFEPRNTENLKCIDCFKANK